MRFMVMHKVTNEMEQGLVPDPAVLAGVDALITEGLKDRVFVGGEVTETKELVAGYAILDLPSKAAAIDWAIRFGEVVRVNEVEVRRVCD